MKEAIFQRFVSKSNIDIPFALFSIVLCMTQ